MSIKLKICCFIGWFIFLSFCKSENFRHDDIIHVPSEDTAICVKISYPEKWTKQDKIIVWSMPPLKDKFFPDSITDKRDIFISPVLRTKLLEAGYLNIEYIGRNDSIVYNNRKYRASDSNTKATDMANLLGFLRANKRLKDKKIILIGHSEGCAINSIVASKNLFDISAIVDLASCVLSGKETGEYQREEYGYKSTLALLGRAYPNHQAFMDSIFNRMSSLDSYHTANMEGIRQFFRENFSPVEAFLYQFENSDSIYFHIDAYLRNRWEKEDPKTKDLYNNDFEKYYKNFYGNVSPQQIALRKYNSEEYYPLIKCPVLLVHGTEDKRVNCYPNLKKMESLMEKGGNRHFEKMILKGYNHDLAKGNNGHQYIPIKEGLLISASSKPDLHIEDSVIDQIIQWIDKR